MIPETNTPAHPYGLISILGTVFSLTVKDLLPWAQLVGIIISAVVGLYAIWKYRLEIKEKKLKIKESNE